MLLETLVRQILTLINVKHMIGYIQFARLKLFVLIYGGLVQVEKRRRVVMILQNQQMMNFSEFMDGLLMVMYQEDKITF